MSNKGKLRNTDNIDFTIAIGDHKLLISVPKATTVHGLLSIVRGYEHLHVEYGPINSHFIGLSSTERNPLIDYWLTQPSLSFNSFKCKLYLTAIYTHYSSITKLSINDFEFLQCLGKGASGSVYLVRSRITGLIFALKRMKKQSIESYRSLQTVIREKNILSSLGNNTHTVTFHGSFESSEHINFLMEYYPGGELFLHLTDTNRVKLTEEEVRIYFCEIVCGMEYLHNCHILYRDLKVIIVLMEPENILVDVYGHLRIADFGLSKYNFAEEDNAFSICGSPEYMAPEILENRNYNFSADFYSIGALLFELLTGYPPYYRQSDDNDSQKLELMKNMSLDFEAVSSNPDIRQLLRNLLNADPQLRMSNYQEIRTSPWLSEVDWKAIESKTSILPFAPRVNRCYIGEEFLEEEEELQQMNAYEDENYDKELEKLIYYVKPESRKLVGLVGGHCVGGEKSKEGKDKDKDRDALSVRERERDVLHVKEKEGLKEREENIIGNTLIGNHSSTLCMKRKKNGQKEGKKILVTRQKTNMSIALYDKCNEENISTASAQTSINSHLTTECRPSRRHMGTLEKENHHEEEVKRETSKKHLSKQPSNTNLLRYGNGNVNHHQLSAVTSQTNLLKGTIQQLTKQQLVTQQQHKINLGRNQLLLNDNKLQPCKTSKSKMKQNMNDNSTYRPTLMTTHCREERSKDKSRERTKEKSLGKTGLGLGMKKKDERRVVLPTCSYKIKLG